MDERNQQMKISSLLTVASLVWLGSSLFAESRQDNRFTPHIDVLQKALDKKEPDLLLSQMIEQEHRAHLFSLEALLRVYGNKYPEELESFLSSSIKPFEDELGRWVDSKEAVDFAQNIGASQKVISYLQGREENERQAFLRFLDNNHFRGRDASRSPLRKLSEALEEVDWQGKGADRRGFPFT